MKTFTTYSELAETVAAAIETNIGGYHKLDRAGVDALDSFVGMKLSGELDGNRGKTIRSILKLFGIAIKLGRLCLVATNSEVVLNLLEQVKPYIKYFSKHVVGRLSAKLSSDPLVNPNEPTTYVEAIVGLSTCDKLGGYIKSAIGPSRLEDDSVMESGENTTAQTEEQTTNKEFALKAEIHRLRKQLDKKNLNEGSDEIFIERIESSIAEVAPSLGFIAEKWHGDKTFNHSETATEVLHISDWHIGEVDNIGGLNQFNYEIACERVKTLTNKVISWTKMHRSMYKVDELVIIATGDMISGDIHDELRATNEFPAPEQCVKSSMLISKMVNELSSVFKKVRVEYIVADNHSRTTKKMEFAPGTNSYNYIVGTMSQILLRGNGNVEFNVYPEIERIINVEGLNYLITHGNSIRGGQLGLPYYGMTRRLGAEALIRMNMADDSHFNRIVMGHYHTPLMTNGIEMTGCLSSTTAFDHASGRHSKACQTGWLVSKKFEMDYSVFWLS